MFDDVNLVSAAGLVPVLRLGEGAGLHDLLDGLSVGNPNAAVKAVAVIGGMLAGADSIDDLDVLRHGGMPRLFDLDLVTLLGFGMPRLADAMKELRVGPRSA